MESEKRAYVAYPLPHRLGAATLQARASAQGLVPGVVLSLMYLPFLLTRHDAGRPLKEPHKTAVGLFNYAHSYAQSAVSLEKNPAEATHPHSPIYFLYFHAVELYLKSLLVRMGYDLEDLRKKHGHKVRPLAKLCQESGLHLSLDAEQAIALMADTDNVISSRYIRVGTHTRLPFPVYQEMCRSLHEQIGWKVYEGSGVSRIPELKTETTRA
ncbi:HEPN domain-containing protein [Roseivivax sp. CAU 1761]